MEVFSYRTGIFKEEKEEISIQYGGNEKKILATTNVYQDFTWVLEKINRNVKCPASTSDIAVLYRQSITNR